MTSTVDIVLEADFDRDGTYETDLTVYANSRGGVPKIARGIEPSGTYRASRMSIKLDNTSELFTPNYQAGSLQGKLGPHAPIRLRATHLTVDYTIWTGYTTYWQNFYGRPPRSMVTVNCVDLAQYLVDGEPVDVAYSASRDTDGAITAIATAMGLGGGDLNLADGVQDLPAHFVRAQSPDQAMREVVASEMGGRMFIQADGKIRFEARNTRLGTSVDGTWGTGTNVRIENPDLLLDPKNIVTKVTARVTKFLLGQDDEVLFSFAENALDANSMSLAAGEIYERVFDAPSAYVSLTTPEAVRDYTANTAINGTGTDKTSALEVTLTLLGGGRFRLRLRNTDASTIYVTRMEIRGQPVEFFADRAQAEFSLSVPNYKAGAGITIDVPFSGDTGGKAAAYAYSILRTWRYINPVIWVDIPWTHDDAIVQALSAELGWLVRLTDTAQWSTRIDDWCYVEAIEHQFPPRTGRAPIRSRFMLVPSYCYRNLDAMAYDTFSRANATGGLGTAYDGGSWAASTGFDINTLAARANSDVLQMPTRDLGASITDQVVECSFSSVGSGDEVGVVFRYADANNQYRCYIDKGDNKIHLEKNVATVVTEITAPAFTVGTTHEMRVIVQGTRIRVWVDFKLYIDTTDSALSAGTKVGMFARNANATTFFGNWYAQGL